MKIITREANSITPEKELNHGNQIWFQNKSRILLCLCLHQRRICIGLLHVPSVFQIPAERVHAAPTSVLLKTKISSPQSTTTSGYMRQSKIHDPGR